MEQNELDLEIIKIYSNEYKNKHSHYWLVYFKFTYAIISILALYFLGKEQIQVYLTTNKTITTTVFCLLILLVGVTSCIILSKEHIALLKMGKRYSELLLKLGYERLPPLDYEKVFSIEKFIDRKLNTSSAMFFSNIVLSILSIIAIIVTSVVF